MMNKICKDHGFKELVWWWKGESKVESFVYFQPVFACFCKLSSRCSWLDELFLIWSGEVNIMINKICKDNVFFIGVMVKRSVEDWEFWSIFSHFSLVFLSWYEYLSQILLWYQVGQHCFVFGVWVAELSLTCWHQECVFLRMLIWFSWEVCNACFEFLSIVDHLRWDMIKVWLSCLLPV